MTAGYGILMFFIGTGLTFIGFFIAFLVLRHNFAKQKEKENRMKFPWEN